MGKTQRILPHEMNSKPPKPDTFYCIRLQGTNQYYVISGQYTSLPYEAWIFTNKEIADEHANAVLPYTPYEIVQFQLTEVDEEPSSDELFEPVRDHGGDVNDVYAAVAGRYSSHGSSTDASHESHSGKDHDGQCGECHSPNPS